MLKTNYSLTKLLSFLLLFVCSLSFAQENEEMKTYSFSELIQMIENEPDTLFQLKNAIILNDPIKDKEYFIDPQRMYDAVVSRKTDYSGIKKAINKHLILENVNFEDREGFLFFKEPTPMFANILFNKSVQLKNVYGIKFINCQFDEKVSYRIDTNFSKTTKSLIFADNAFRKSFRFFSWQEIDDVHEEQQVVIIGNKFVVSKELTTLISFNQNIVYNVTISENKFYGSGESGIIVSEPKNLEIHKNVFAATSTYISISITDDTPKQFMFSENSFRTSVDFYINNLSPSFQIDWDQFSGKINAFDGVHLQRNEHLKEMTLEEALELKGNNQGLNDLYRSNFRVENDIAYKAEMAIRGEFFRFFKDNFDKESANAVYIELKDLETQRLKYKHNESPSFDGYFKWKINQFLKVFSDYGTNPAKSIMFSIYVIFIFGAFYLFFPNSWDSHGKNRIMHRYSFFMKYMVKDAGIHEVYLEEKQQEFDEYREFGRVIDESKNKVPRFFTSTSLLLLRWAKSGSVVSAFLLKRIDVMKGKWAELTKGRRIWKSILLIVIFTIAVIYDIFIKMLNALMLSINTFTTLGFGEIPIRGLPRYLAIMQGFIGWFLLTIFSVSLISQLME